IEPFSRQSLLAKSLESSCQIAAFNACPQQTGDFGRQFAVKGFDSLVERCALLESRCKSLRCCRQTRIPLFLGQGGQRNLERDSASRGAADSLHQQALLFAAGRSRMVFVL